MDGKPLLVEVARQMEDLKLEIEGTPIRGAALDDIIRSKRAARRPRDLAVLDVLEQTRDEINAETRAAARPRQRK